MPMAIVRISVTVHTGVRTRLRTDSLNSLVASPSIAPGVSNENAIATRENGVSRGQTLGPCPFLGREGLLTELQASYLCGG